MGFSRGAGRGRGSFSRGGGNFSRGAGGGRAFGGSRGGFRGRGGSDGFVKKARKPAPPMGDSTESISLSFNNFDFQEMKSIGKKGGGVRELYANLKKARQMQTRHTGMLQSSDGAEERRQQMLSTALDRAAGKKIKDDPKRIAKALAKRRNKKRQSAKKWAQRKRNLQESVDNYVDERRAQKQRTIASKEAKKNKKAEKRGTSSGGKGGKGKPGAGAKGARKDSKGGKGGKKSGGGKGGKGGGKKGGQKHFKTFG